MADASRDPNHVPAALLYDAGSVVVRAWKADSVTGRALIDVADLVPPTPTPSGQIALRDPNRKPVLMGLVDGTTTLVPLMCDTDGYIVMDLTVEP